MLVLSIHTETAAYSYDYSNMAENINQTVMNSFVLQSVAQILITRD